MMKTLFKNRKKIFKFIISYFLIVGLFQYLGDLASGIDLNNRSENQGNTMQMFVITVFGLMGTLLTIWIFVRYVDKDKFINLGFKKTNYQHLVLGVVTGLVIMVTGFYILLFMRQITFLKLQFNIMDVILSIGMCIAIAISEEVIMRGYVLNKLMNHLNQWAALAISAVFFSLMHVFNPNMGILSIINLFLAGVLLGLPFVFTKNLWYSIALHFSWNFFQGTLGFKVSGMNFYAIVIQGKLPDTIWNGATFGFDGSLLCTIFQLIAIPILYFIFRSFKKPSREQGMVFEG